MYSKTPAAPNLFASISAMIAPMYKQPEKIAGKMKQHKI
jgi:hypothetical protein